MTEYRLTALCERHDVSSFHCGEPSIDRYLVNEAMAAQAAGTARTHVWVPSQDGAGDEVAAYFTLAPTMIQPNDLPLAARLSDRRPIPGYLLAKLGLTESLRGRHLGADLLLDAIGMAVRAADAAGGRVLVVDSLENNKVHAFYRAADFIEIASSYRLWMKISTARAALTAT